MAYQIINYMYQIIQYKLFYVKSFRSIGTNKNVLTTNITRFMVFWCRMGSQWDICLGLMEVPNYESFYEILLLFMYQIFHT